MATRGTRTKGIIELLGTIFTFLDSYSIFDIKKQQQPFFVCEAYFLILCMFKYFKKSRLLLKVESLKSPQYPSTKQLLNNVKVLVCSSNICSLCVNTCIILLFKPIICPLTTTLISSPITFPVMQPVFQIFKLIELFQPQDLCTHYIIFLHHSFPTSSSFMCQLICHFLGLFVSSNKQLYPNPCQYLLPLFILFI